MSLNDIMVRGPCDTTGCRNEAKVHYGLEEFYCLDCHEKNKMRWDMERTEPANPEPGERGTRKEWRQTKARESHEKEERRCLQT